jgi:hypothetical protein
MRRILPVLVAGLLLAALAAPASGAATPSTWHRDNYGNGHERLICTSTSGVWQCRLDTMPNYPADVRNNDIGELTGSAQDGWCPEWAGDVCGHVQQIVVGALVFSARQSPFTVWDELLFTDGEGVAPM